MPPKISKSAQIYDNSNSSSFESEASENEKMKPMKMSSCSRMIRKIGSVLGFEAIHKKKRSNKRKARTFKNEGVQAATQQYDKKVQIEPNCEHQETQANQQKNDLELKNDLFNFEIETEQNLKIANLEEKMERIEKDAKSAQEQLIFDNQNQKILLTAELNKDKIEYKSHFELKIENLT